MPPEIAGLGSLCYLKLSNNRFEHLDTELGQVTSLINGTACGEFNGLRLDGNPLISPPPEVVEQGTPAILAYLQNETWWYLQGIIPVGAAFAAILTIVILGFRWRNRRSKKKKVLG